MLAPFLLSPCRLFSLRWVSLATRYIFTDQEKQIRNWPMQFILWSKRALKISPTHNHIPQKYKTYGMSAGQITRAMVKKINFSIAIINKQEPCKRLKKYYQVATSPDGDDPAEGLPLSFITSWGEQPSLGRRRRSRWLSFQGMGGLFLCHAGALVLGAVFTFAFVPETRNKSLTQLEQIFKKNGNSENKVWNKEAE